MKKILFVTGSMGRGGAERVISLLSSYYIKNGWDVSIAMLLHNSVKYELPQEIKIVDCSSKNGIKKGFLRVIKKFRVFVQKEKPDVIVSFMAQNILISGIALIGIKIPFIVSERIDPASVKRNIIYKFLLNRIYEKSDLVIFQTKRAQKYFNKKIQNNSCIICNPIKIYSEKSKKSKHKIVSIGRLTDQKNQELLIRSFDIIHSKYPQYNLYIYGEGYLRNKLENIIKSLNLTESVFLPGSVSDIHEKIRDAELFVLSSNFEGLSNALMEAMLMGLPVISTDCAGSDEIIISGKNGLLVPINDKDKMVEAIEKIIEDSDLRQLLSKNAKESMQKYKEGNIIETWVNTIEKVISNYKIR